MSPQDKLVTMEKGSVLFDPETREKIYKMPLGEGASRRRTSLFWSDYYDKERGDGKRAYLYLAFKVLHCTVTNLPLLTRVYFFFFPRCVHTHTHCDSAFLCS